MNDLKSLRISFAIYATALLSVVINFFFIYEKKFMTYEVGIAAILYFWVLRLIVLKSETKYRNEMAFYFVMHAFVAFVAIFLHFADGLATY